MTRLRWWLALLALPTCAPLPAVGPVPHDGDVSRFLVPGAAPATATGGDRAAGPTASRPELAEDGLPRPEPPYTLAPTPGATGAAASGSPSDLAARGPSDPAARAPVDLAARAPVDAGLRRTARRLAGLTTEAPVAQQARQEQHSQAVTRSFTSFEERNGQAMLAWAREQLVAAAGATVFYPFAGPDLVTARRFYPDAARYVLLALQDGGPPPALDGLSAADLDATLDLYAGVFEAFARRGFFVTAQMGAGYRTPRAVRGVTGVLLAFAEREGLAVESIEPVQVGATGVEPVAGDRRDADTWASVRLHLRRSDGAAVLVDYLKVDLSDAGLGHEPGAATLLRALARGPTVLKAASHLLQQPGFVRLRDLVLAGAPQLVQDETGVAFGRLEAFDVRLFGSFRRVNGLFDGRPQRELAAAYARGDARPLPFSVGYRKEAGAALMVATRR